MDQRAAVAAIRYGLGRRLEDAPPADPVAWLDGQLHAGAPPALPEDIPATLPSIFAALDDERAERARLREAGLPQPPGPPLARRLVIAEGGAYLVGLLGTEAPFRERLVAFWANHFTVSAARGGLTAATAGHFVRAAIRPHVTGRFADMLLAVVRHPAMLSFLDNAGSVGPGSPAGRRSGRGLNENLAREVLELHTVSPAAGYTQEDVTEFARILTGWSVESRREPVGFRFRPHAHEPGSKTVLGRRFEEGEEGGIEALRWLAVHPATHRHLATKLARHFVADTPPPEAVEALYGILRDTQGDLGAVSRALIRLPEAWTPPLTKLRSPLDYVVAVLRGLGAPPEADQRLFNLLARLGQPLWSAPAPDGWPDSAESWAAPEATLRRIEWVHGLTARFIRLDAQDLAQVALGPLARTETLRAAARAASPRDALTLVLTSPEFQRR